MPRAIEQRPPKSALAGLPAPKRLLVDLSRLEREYFDHRPEPDDRRQLVRFGTSGHCGSPLLGTFTEAHVLAITQAICDYRSTAGTGGPLYVGMDTHAVSSLAQDTVLTVLAANGVETVLQQRDEVTPTPVISRAIVVYNRLRKSHLADGIVITPSHNPPEDGGLKYNSFHGGPADSDAAQWIQDRANELMRRNNGDVKRTTFARAISGGSTHEEDLLLPYVNDLAKVVDMEAIRDARLKLAVDPLGGASVRYWERLNSVYGLDIEIVNPAVDPTFSFMPVDHDGRIRMDCASPYAMARLIGIKDRYQLVFGNGPDAGRHCIVTPGAGLISPNQYLAAAIRYLLSHRPQWPALACVGKTVVNSSMIDAVVQQARRSLAEMPVGFNWFARGLFDKSCCFGAEEGAGASFLCRDGAVWTTDNDGLASNLLAAEITAATGRDPAEHCRELIAELGASYYRRIEVPATPEQRGRLERLSPLAICDSTLGGHAILAKLNRAPANDVLVGGLKVVTSAGWFAARPSGGENTYKLYAESFVSEAHLDIIVSEARDVLRRALVA